MDLVTIDPGKCQREGACIAECPAGLFEADADGFPLILADLASSCIACGHCVAVCPGNAVMHRLVTREGSPHFDPLLAISAESAAQFLKSRRSIRKFRSLTVPDELIARVIDPARWAPSASNRQPVHWLIIREPREVRRLAGLAVECLRRDEMMQRCTAAWNAGRDMILRGAPHLALAHALENDWGAIDCATALSYFELSAHAQGLGTCWAGLFTRATTAYPLLAEALALPEGHKLYGALMFGYPRYCYHRIPERRGAKIVWR